MIGLDVLGAGTGKKGGPKKGAAGQPKKDSAPAQSALPADGDTSDKHKEPDGAEGGFLSKTIVGPVKVWHGLGVAAVSAGAFVLLRRRAA